MPDAKNLCLFTGKISQFRHMLVGEFKDIHWGYGTLFLADSAGSNGQYITIQAWGEIAQNIAELDYGTWIEISSSFQESKYKGRPQYAFLIGTYAVKSEHD